MTEQTVSSSRSNPDTLSNHVQGAATIRLRVRDMHGRDHVIDLPAANEAEAVRRAAARGLGVLAIESAAQPGDEMAGRHVRFSLLLFSQELLALLDAGLNLTEVLTTLLAKERQATVRAVLQGIVQQLSEGRNFSDVLAERPEHFPEVYVATIRAAERTGDLSRALARYIAYQIQFDAIRKMLISTAIYPAMLLAAGGFVTLFLLGYVVPRFATVYESAGRDVPWMSSVLLAVGKVIHQNWVAVFIGSSAMLAGGILGLSRPGGRRFVMDRFMRLPWLAERSEEFRLARFYRAVSLLLASGVALPRAMGMVSGLLSAAQQPGLASARNRIEQGQSLSAALLAENLASPVAESLIKVGERSGQLADMLERTARFHDEDFGRWIEWFSRLLEPVLMASLGIVIGAVVVLMYMPIFDLAGSLQ
jgi:general secretion pathway protein F